MKNQSITTVKRLHPVGTMNVWTKSVHPVCVWKHRINAVTVRREKTETGNKDRNLVFLVLTSASVLSWYLELFSVIKDSYITSDDISEKSCLCFLWSGSIFSDNFSVNIFLAAGCITVFRPPDINDSLWPVCCFSSLLIMWSQSRVGLKLHRLQSGVTAAAPRGTAVLSLRHVRLLLWKSRAAGSLAVLDWQESAM